MPDYHRMIADAHDREPDPDARIARARRARESRPSLRGRIGATLRRWVAPVPRLGHDDGIVPTLRDYPWRTNQG
jgi:hypothetical protein